MPADPVVAQDTPDMSWIDIAVLGEKRGVVVLDYAPGWSEYIDDLHFADVFEGDEPDHLPAGGYRWSGYRIGSWEEGDAIVCSGGEFVPHRTPAPAGDVRVVPVGPTPEMLRAGAAAIEDTDQENVDDNDVRFWGQPWRPCASAAWSAMLAASPTPDSSAVSGSAEAVLAWLTDCDNLTLSHSTTSDAWQVRRASGMIRGEGATPLEALTSARRAALTEGQQS